MKGIVSSLFLYLIINLLTSCEVSDSDNGLKNVNDIENSLEDLNVASEEAIKGNRIDEDKYIDDWEPNITNTPIKKLHKPFILPCKELRNIRNYFYENVDKEKYQRAIIENEYILEGYVNDSNGAIFSYSFQKENGKCLGRDFYLSSNYLLKEELQNKYKDIVYKMLEINEIENPNIFLDNLMNSPKITKYKGCTVQQKKVKYGVIDLTMCEDDDATVLALYNPEPE